MAFAVRFPFLFGLAPCGVCHAPRITARAVRSYRTFSPLPRACAQGGIFSVALSVRQAWTCLPGRYPAHCSAEFGLSSLNLLRAGEDPAVQETTATIRSSINYKYYKCRWPTGSIC